MSSGFSSQEEAASIVRNLRLHGYESYFAGGCVRDRVMNRQPKDYDIATSATPQEIAALFPNTIGVGASFGVMIVLGQSGQYEVATFRTDMGYSDGRHPDAVRFSSAREDAQRRDFTLNGMFYDPLEDRVIDHVGGCADIEGKTIRAIGDPLHRFKEDRLRMLRAVRFAARFGFGIETETYKAIVLQASAIHCVSAERIRDEMTKILIGPRAGWALRCLLETGLLREILPEIAALSGVRQPQQFHPEGDVFEHTCVLLDRMVEPTNVLAWAGLLHDVGKPATYHEAPDRIRFHNHHLVGAKMADEICLRLKFSNEERAQIVACVENHMAFMNVQVMRPSTLKRLLRRPTFNDELELHRLDCLASHGDISNFVFLEKALEGFAEEEIRPPRLITGKDLIEAGYNPGPRFKEILEEVETLQLENKLHNHDEAMKWVLENYQQEKLKSPRGGDSI